MYIWFFTIAVTSQLLPWNLFITPCFLWIIPKIFITFQCQENTIVLHCCIALQYPILLWNIIIVLLLASSKLDSPNCLFFFKIRQIFVPAIYCKKFIIFFILTFFYLGQKSDYLKNLKTKFLSNIPLQIEVAMRYKWMSLGKNFKKSLQKWCSELGFRRQ